MSPKNMCVSGCVSVCHLTHISQLNIFIFLFANVGQIFMRTFMDFKSEFKTKLGRNDDADVETIN